MPPSVGDIMDPPRCIATVRLPCQGVPCICALTSSAAAGPALPAAAPGAALQGRREASGVQLAAATAEGILYQYHIRGLRSPGGPKCTLEGECLLLGQGF